MICSLKQDDPDAFIFNETDSSDLNESLVLYVFSETERTRSPVHARYQPPSKHSSQLGAASKHPICESISDFPIAGHSFIHPDRSNMYPSAWKHTAPDNFEMQQSARRADQTNEHARTMLPRRRSLHVFIPRKSSISQGLSAQHRQAATVISRCERVGSACRWCATLKRADPAPASFTDHQYPARPLHHCLKRGRL
jgi:hypothetical protein